MRKIVCSIAAAILMAFTLQSCSTNSPKAAADKFLTSFYHMDFDEAKKVSTDDTKKMLDMLQQLTPMMPDSSKQQLKKIKVDLKTVTQSGDTASVIYVTSDNPKDQTLHMIKKDGKWLAQWSKQDSMGGGDQGQPADQPAMGGDSTAMPPANPTGTPADTGAPKQ